MDSGEQIGDVRLEKYRMMRTKVKLNRLNASTREGTSAEQSNVVRQSSDVGHSGNTRLNGDT